MALCDFDTRRLRRTLTYLLTYYIETAGLQACTVGAAWLDRVALLTLAAERAVRVLTEPRLTQLTISGTLVNVCHTHTHTHTQLSINHSHLPTDTRHVVSNQR